MRYTGIRKDPGRTIKNILRRYPLDFLAEEGPGVISKETKRTMRHIKEGKDGAVIDDARCSDGIIEIVMIFARERLPLCHHRRKTAASMRTVPCITQGLIDFPLVVVHEVKRPALRATQTRTGLDRDD